MYDAETLEAFAESCKLDYELYSTNEWESCASISGAPIREMLIRLASCCATGHAVSDLIATSRFTIEKGRGEILYWPHATRERYA